MAKGGYSGVKDRLCMRLEGVTSDAMPHGLLAMGVWSWNVHGKGTLADAQDAVRIEMLEELEARGKRAYGDKRTHMR